MKQSKKKTNQKPNNRYTVYLGSWSASTSPARSPSPLRYPHGGPHRGKQNQLLAYGTTSLMQRSRSPSPARLQEMRERGRRAKSNRYNYLQFEAKNINIKK